MSVVHRCHARRCKTTVAPARLMCPTHWRMVPREMQQAVWAAYVPGQERRKDPSRAYIAAARAAIDEVARKERVRDTNRSQLSIPGTEI